MSSHHEVTIEREGNTYYLDYYKEDEPVGYPLDAFPRDWDGDLEDYPLENYPGYREGMPPDTIETERFCFLDEVEALTGRTWGGSQGIGELTDVGLIMPTEHEEHPLWARDERFFLLRKGLPDAEILRQQMEIYADTLEAEGVTVHTFDMPIWGVYGPMRKLYMAEEVMVTKAGAILSRFNHGPYKRGLNQGFQRFLTDVGCPIIRTIHGYGIQELGPWVPIGENVTVGHLGTAGNQDGVDQLLPDLARAGFEEVHLASLPYIGDSFDSGGEFHIDMLLAAVDEGVALVLPKYLDYETRRFLDAKGFNLIEIPHDEHVDYVPGNLITLAPGKVLMPEGAEETIRRVREHGVEVVTVPTDQILKGGTNGVRCTTLHLARKEGPGVPNPE